MLGTVSELLGLDFSANNMENIKTNFFIALTLTAWGIIFSLIFKFINSFALDFIESQMEWGKREVDKSKTVREDND